MKIGIAGPVALPMLRQYVRRGESLPQGYSFPSTSILIEGFLSRGHRVVVYALDPNIVEPTTFYGERLTIHIGRYRPAHRARDLFAVERSDLARAMRADPCDLIHAHWTYEFALAVLASGQPHLITAHDAPWQVLRFNLSPYRCIRTIMAYQVAARARHMTAVSPYLVDHFRKFMLYRGPIHVVPNALPDGIFALANQRQFRSGSGTTFATVLPGWAGHKNGQVAIEAFHKVRRKLPGARLLMFGSGHGPGELAQQWAVNRAYDQGIEFIGMTPYRELLRRLVSDVDILVHPSLEESFCMAIAEAMAMGIPVIGGRDSGAVPHTLEDGRVGVLTDVRSADALAESMATLSGDAPLRSRLSRSGYESALRRFHLDQVIRRYEELYEGILKGNNPTVS